MDWRDLQATFRLQLTFVMQAQLMLLALLMFRSLKLGQSFLTRQHRLPPGFKNLASISFFSPKTKWGNTRFFAETLVTGAENSTAILDVPLGTTIVADSEEFQKPDRDVNEYRYIRLKNNLQILLVSSENACSAEEESAKSEAASVHVQAGHFDDTVPGLAHFHVSLR